MANTRVVFEILEPNQSTPIGWKDSSSNLVYNVNMDLTCKAWWMKYGNKTSEIDQYTYAGVVFRNKVSASIPPMLRLTVLTS